MPVYPRLFQIQLKYLKMILYESHKYQYHCLLCLHGDFELFPIYTGHYSFVSQPIYIRDAYKMVPDIAPMHLYFLNKDFFPRTIRYSLQLLVH